MEKIGKLNIERTGQYEIELPDGGSLIVDLQDVEFPLKFQKLFEDCEKIDKSINGQLAVLKTKKAKNIGLITDLDKKRIEIERKGCQEVRKAIDELFGEGTCNSIFGKVNYRYMWIDFFNSMKPLFDKMGDIQISIEETIAKKYGDEDDDTL